VSDSWLLALVYWLHMLATVTWIGGLASLSLLILPAAHKTLPADAYAAFLRAIQRRLDPLGWFSLVILAGTGMIQMGASPNYAGFLTIDNQWAAAILIKHILFLGMVGISAYLTWGLLPRLQRLAIMQARLVEQPEEAAQQGRALQQQEVLLLRLNLGLGVLVLALTSLARAAS
jgi:uncharacterized membrane protein